MKNKISPKLVSLSFGVLVLTFALGFYIFAWTEPGQAPPGGNILAPLNIGPAGQSKEGGLILNTGGASSGLIVDKGDVGIGITTPGYKLDVVGSVNATELCISGDCNPSSWLSGASSKYFGDGSDGDVTISSTVTLARDMNYNNLTVQGGRVLKTNGFQIFIKGTLQNSGRIENVGNAGVGETGGTGAAGKTVGPGSAGGLGGYLNYACGGNPVVGPTAGGAGGIGGGGISQIKSFTALYLTRLNSGGGGTGGSASATGNCLMPGGSGGGGGGGGGTMVIFAKTFINSGTIIVQGGTGGNSTCASDSNGTSYTYGGVGGGGGFIAIGATGTPTVGTINVSGGSGGNNCNIAGVASSGTNGNYIIFNF
ncbi:MAG: hypothetical protein Q7T34_02440 [Candidatus Parcubacteria bacterium]|nr:hypothetical protein [Candidatus Parcubacteria bacterium]